ncbi:MAG TPA: hypothetical protein VNS58_13870 [Puia sp.]|nr:hypothetical protein [Puia sp.]
MQSDPLNNILVIDEVPTIALGLQETLRPLHHPIKLKYTDNLFTALSSPSYEGKKFDLLIIGEQTGHPIADWPQSAAELKSRFGPARIMLYTPNYDPILIEKMNETGIDAYVHKYEPVEEIRKAWSRLSAGESYISAIFHTLYYEYNLRLDKMSPPENHPKS